MSDDCYCDYDAPRWYSAKIRRARTEHRCGECGCTIRIGERYEDARGMVERVYRAKTCERCIAVREFVQAHVPCFCWAHFNLIDDCRDTVEEYAHETVGLYFGTQRRIIRAQRRASADMELRWRAA